MRVGALVGAGVGAGTGAGVGGVTEDRTGAVTVIGARVLVTFPDNGADRDGKESV
jgi:tetrahydrodipicolinate N-succinyltransferase